MNPNNNFNRFYSVELTEAMNINVDNFLEQPLKMGNTLFHRADLAILSIKGPDSRNFLQRLSSNDLSKLNITSPLCTCFLNQKGRMVDLVYVFEQDHDHFILVSSFKNPHVLLDWLNKF